MPTVKRIWKVGGFRPINPKIIADDGGYGDWSDVVNSINCPRGRQYGEANFLMQSADAQSLCDTSGPISIVCESELGTITFENYWVTKCTAITAHKTQPAYWITLGDVRYILERSTANKRYNLRKTASTWVTSSLNGGTPYTWQEILDDLWSLLPSAAGSAPTLPITPSSTPENFVFDGMSAWRAINQVLTAIGCGSVFLPLSDIFTYVELKATQAGLDTVKTGYANRLLFQFTPRELPKANFPEKVVVTFHKIPGTDDTDSPFPIKPDTEEATLGESGTAGTKWPIVDTMFSTAGNAAARTTRAGEIKDALRGLLKPLAKPWGAVYAGALAFLPGSEISDITWSSDGTRGMQTVAKYSYQPFDWPELITDGGGSSAWIEYVIQTITTPTGGHYAGLRVATVIVKGGNDGNLIDTEVEVVDHSGGLFDEPGNMTGYTGWALWGVYKSLQPSIECDTLTPAHWAAVNRVCDPNTGIYAEPCA